MAKRKTAKAKKKPAKKKAARKKPSKKKPAKKKAAKKKAAKKKPAKKKPAKKKASKKKASKKKASKKKASKKKASKKKASKKKPAKKKPSKKKPSKKKPSKKKPSKKKVRGKPSVEQWTRRLSPGHQKIVNGLRKLIRSIAPHLDEAIKWSQPVFSGRQPICYIMARSTGHVTFGFWNGKQLDDPERVLEGAGGRMRHLKLHRWGEVSAEVLTGLIRQATALDGA